MPPTRSADTETSPRSPVMSSVFDTIGFCLHVARIHTVTILFLRIVATAGMAVVVLAVAHLIGAWRSGAPVADVVVYSVMGGAGFAAQQLAGAVATTLVTGVGRRATLEAMVAYTRQPAATTSNAGWSHDAELVAHRSAVEDLVSAVAGVFAAKLNAVAAAVMLTVASPLSGVVAIVGVGVAYVLARRTVEAPVTPAATNPSPGDVLTRMTLDPSALVELRVLGARDWMSSVRHGEPLPAGRPYSARTFGVAVIVGVTAVAALGIPLAGTGGVDLAMYAVVVQAFFVLVTAGRFDVPDLALAQAGRIGRSSMRRARHQPGPPSNARATVPVGKTLNDARVGIRVHGVTHRYPGLDHESLSNVSLEIRPGEILAVAGENGAGKTTLARVLSGALTPQEGTRSVDIEGGAACTGEPAGSLRVARLEQDFPRYPLSLADNITAGYPQDVALLTAVIHAVALGDVIDALPQGAATPLVEDVTGGVNLSGGQWQRVALARALYRLRVTGAGLLILDEPLSHADVLFEREFHDTFVDLRLGQTTVVISHRLPAVRRADRIAFLDRGRLIATGSHEELLLTSPEYRGMYDAQARRYGGAG